MAKVETERFFGKKGIIIMIRDGNKLTSAIFKDKKNADKFNRNNPSDVKKLLQLAKKTKFPKAIDEGKKRYNVMYGVGSSKYTVNFHDGKSKHKDGSDFFDIAIFKNKRDLAKKINDLTKKGYIYSYQEGVNEGSMDWEKHFKGYNEKELKVISKLIFMNPQGIDGVIKMSKKKDFKPFIKKAAKKGLHEGYGPFIKAKNLNDIIKLSKQKKNATFYVTDDNNSRIGTFYLKNGKFAKATTANPNYDFQRNKTNLKDRSDVIYKYKVDESVNEASKEAMGIAAFTGTRGVAVDDFIKKNKIDARKLFNFVRKGNLRDRMDFVTAIAGKPNNKFFKMIVGRFAESINEAFLVAYAKGPKPLKPAFAAYADKKMAQKFMADMKRDGYKVMMTQKKIRGIDESKNKESKVIQVMQKYSKTEKKFYDKMAEHERRIGPRDYKKFIDKALRGFGENPNKYKTVPDAEEKLYNLSK